MKRLCWMYSSSFSGNPIALQAVRTLADDGWDVVLLDSGGSSSDAFYSGYDHRVARTRLPKYLFVEYVLRYLGTGLHAKPDLVIASQPIVLFAAWLVSIIYNIPVVYYTWELYGEEEEPVGIRKYFTWLMVKLERFLLRRVDSVIHASEDRKAVYIEERNARPNNNWVIHDYMEMTPSNDGGSLKLELGIGGNDHKILIYTGALMAGRCLPELVDALHLINDPNVILVCVGRNIHERYWEDNIEPLIEKYALTTNVINLGWVHPDNLRSYITDADAGIMMYEPTPRNNYFCTSSRWGHYINEGIPVIASPFPYPTRIVDKYGIGICSKSCRPVDIATAIQKILSKPKYAWEESFIAARNDLCWQKESRTLLSIIQSVVSPSSKD